MQAPEEGRPDRGAPAGWSDDTRNLVYLLNELAYQLDYHSPTPQNVKQSLRERIRSARLFVSGLEQVCDGTIGRAYREAICRDGEAAAARVHHGDGDEPLRVFEVCQRCSSECADPDYSGCEHCRGEVERLGSVLPLKIRKGDYRVEGSTPEPVFRPPAVDELPRHRGSGATEPWPYGDCDDAACWCKDQRANVDAFLLAMRGRAMRSCGSHGPNASREDPGPDPWAGRPYPPPVSGS
jgi:hypothetical protein